VTYHRRHHITLTSWLPASWHQLCSSVQEYVFYVFFRFQKNM